MHYNMDFQFDTNIDPDIGRGLRSCQKREIIRISQLLQCAAAAGARLCHKYISATNAAMILQPQDDFFQT